MRHFLLCHVLPLDIQIIGRTVAVIISRGRIAAQAVAVALRFHDITVVLYPAAYLLRGAGYKISPPPLGGQVGYEIALHLSRLRSPFGVEFGFTHYWGYAMMR